MAELIDFSDNTTDPITFELLDKEPMSYIRNGVKYLGYEAIITGLKELIGQHVPGIDAPIVGIESYCLGHLGTGSRIAISVVVT